MRYDIKLTMARPTENSWHSSNLGLPFLSLQELRIKYQRLYVEVDLAQCQLTKFVDFKPLAACCELSPCLAQMFGTTHMDDKNRFSSASVIPHITTVPYWNRNISATVGTSSNLLFFLRPDPSPCALSETAV